MSEEIPLKPLTKSDIHKLETALMVATLLREDVLEKMKHAEERLTWLDSLGVAAGALAREKAGYTISRIAEELGRTEATIRNHLAGKTEAGKLVRETFKRFVREGVKIEVPVLETVPRAEFEKLKKELDEVKKKLEENEKRLDALKQRVSEALTKLKEATSLLESL
ncbi:MAG TPA: transcriptional regulator [Thermoprotei archaeon]|nr:MAG: transcriptional regulator [Thermoprotei archaeon]HDI74651.1 transcriptional regulator [Thermoprotei archaeon]